MTILAKAGGQVASFATNPLWKDVDGPFQLKTFSPTNSSYTLVPNPSYGGTPKPYISQLSVQTYTGITPQLNALRTGSLDIAQLDFSQLGQVNSLRSQGYSVYGYPPFGWFGAIINFKDKTGHFDKIIGQLYVRQALAHLIDQPAYVKGIFKNAGVAGLRTGPLGPARRPTRRPTPRNPPYPFNPSAAVSLLKSPRLERGARRADDLRQGRHGEQRVRRRASRPGRRFKFTWFYIPPSTTPSSAPGVRGLRLRGQEGGGDQHPARAPRRSTT